MKGSLLSGEERAGTLLLRGEGSHREGEMDVQNLKMLGNGRHEDL